MSPVPLLFHPFLIIREFSFSLSHSRAPVLSLVCASDPEISDEPPIFFHFPPPFPIEPPRSKPLVCPPLPPSPVSKAKYLPRGEFIPSSYHARNADGFPPLPPSPPPRLSARHNLPILFSFLISLFREIGMTLSPQDLFSFLRPVLLSLPLFLRSSRLPTGGKIRPFPMIVRIWSGVFCGVFLCPQYSPLSFVIGRCFRFTPLFL